MNSYISNNLEDNAVKAIIYNEEGQILLQKRDLYKNIPFAGCWNFFGGLVENNEDLVTALKRELVEEISCLPGHINEKFFDWTWKSQWKKTINHFYPILCNVADNKFKLNEGSEFKWFQVHELIQEPLVPAIYHNFSKIFELISTNLDEKEISDKIKLIESSYIAFNNLRKKNERVFYSTENEFKISNQQTLLFKELSVINKQEVTRICLHKNDEDNLHEMIMVHSKPVKVGPLKQNKNNISYHIIYGSIEISIYDDSNKYIRSHILNSISFSNNELSSIRISAKDYRLISTLSSYAVFIEITNGPFDDQDTIWL